MTFTDAHYEPVSSLKITPDELYIVSTSKDSTVKVWDIRQNKILFKFEDQTNFEISSYNQKICISPNGEYVVAGSN